MIVIALIFTALSTALCLYLLIKSKGAFSRILIFSLLSSFVVIAVVLLSILDGKDAYLDIAITLTLLGFIDIQFYAVYLRRKGDL